MQTWPPTHRPQCIQCPIQKEDVTAAINKNHSSLFYPKRGKLEGMVSGRPFPLHQRHRAVPCCSNHCLSPIHCLTSVTHRYFFSFSSFFLYLFFRSPPWQYFQSKQHPFKKSTAKMRWKWKKKRTRRLQRKRRKMRARAK